MANYDIFISYRRKGGFDTAKHLYDLLTRDGYKVSFDIDTLRNGDFDKELLKRIDECTDFLLILDKHCFDRLNEGSYQPKNDWLRQELAYALKKRKNIVPIFHYDFDGFPNDLPPDILPVVRKNGPRIVKEYYDAFFVNLKKQFLDTPPPKKESPKTLNPANERGPVIREVKVSFTSNLPCSILANGASCCSIGDSLSQTKYLYPGEYTFKCISKSDRSNVLTIKYTVKNVSDPQYIKIEFEPSAADLGVTQEQFNQYKKLNPGYSTSVTKFDVISTLDDHQRQKNEATKENAKSILVLIGVIVLIVIALIMISSGVSVILTLGICACVGTAVGKATGLIG